MNSKHSVGKTELKLPIIKNDSPSSIRSIDEIIEWIDELYMDVFDREQYEKEKKLFSVNVPFILRK